MSLFVFLLAGSLLPVALLVSYPLRVRNSTLATGKSANQGYLALWQIRIRHQATGLHLRTLKALSSLQIAALNGHTH